MSEKEKQMVQKLKDLVVKQGDAIRAKDHELTLRSEDIEAVRLKCSSASTKQHTPYHNGQNLQ